MCVCVLFHSFLCIICTLPYLTRPTQTPHKTQNHRYARGVTLMGDALGHSWVGLLLARAIDPQLQTPVPLAFTYKLLVRCFYMYI